MMTSWSIEPMHGDQGSTAPPRDREVTPMRWPGSGGEQHRRPLRVDGWAEIAADEAALEVEDLPATPQAPAVEPSLRFDEADLARACAAAAGDACRRATALASSSSAAQQVELLQRIGGEITVLREALANDAARAGQELVATARAIAQALTFRHDDDRLAELEAITHELVRQAPHGAGLTLEVAAAAVEALRPRLASIGLAIVAGSDLGPLDVRIRWQDGWVEQLRAELEAAIDAVLVTARPEAGARRTRSPEEQP